MINLYLFDDFDSIEYCDIEKAIELMPLERKEKALKYRKKKDKYLCIIAYFLLMYAIYTEYGIKGSLELLEGKYGKPYLKEYSNIFVNISHCSSGVACVVSNKEIGVDVQDIQDSYSEIIDIACCNEELNMMKGVDNKEELFYKMWTIKESYIKADGRGMHLNIKDINTSKKINACIKYKDMIISVHYKDNNKIIIEKNINVKLVDKLKLTYSLYIKN